VRRADASARRPTGRSDGKAKTHVAVTVELTEAEHWRLTLGGAKASE
jgi:hypothetical protein